MVATREESEEGINFRVDSDAWYVVRNTNGVTGFVGVGSDPIPMEDDEVENIFRVIGMDIPEEEKESWDWMRWLPHATLQDMNVRSFVYNQRTRDQV